MKSERESDGRKLDHKTLEAVRIRAVQQILSGQSPEAVIAALGMNRRTVYRWLEQYHYGGWEALKAKPISGRPPKLNAKQMAWLSRTIRDKNPQQLKFEFALWTLAMVRQLIRDRFSVRLSEVSVGRILRTLGFTPQRPLYRAWQQDKELVDRWLKEDFPEIRKLAKKNRALVFFGDESGIRSDYHAGTTWSQKGATPVVQSSGARYSLNMLSAVSPQGHFRFMTVAGSVKAKQFCEFLQRLVSGVDRKIFLILDRHPVHRSRAVKRLIERLDGKLTIFFLPPYSPELNPDELVWGHVKGRMGRQVTGSKDNLVRRARAVLRSLQASPEKVKSFFYHPTCRYVVE